MQDNELEAIKDMFGIIEFEHWDNENFSNEGDYLFYLFFDVNTNEFKKTDRILNVYDLSKMNKEQQKLIMDESFRLAGEAYDAGEYEIFGD